MLNGVRNVLRMMNHFVLQISVLLAFYFKASAGSSFHLVEEYACFNTVFYFVCDEGQIAVFETARFGRNDTIVAALCGIPFTRNCDIDVHFLLNRACAGKRKCSIAVNTAFFGDPCGYEEFLKVTYRCIPEWSVDSRCSESSTVTLFDHGYITSPNYPDKYFMDAECQWDLVVQTGQLIHITLFDFELDVKRGGRCFDFLEVSVAGRVYFRDCGALGKQVIDIEWRGDEVEGEREEVERMDGGLGGATEASVVFKTGQTSLTQRGFLLYFEAVGRGCPVFDQYHDRFEVIYFVTDHVFHANITCFDGFYLDVETKSTSVVIRCLGVTWSGRIPECFATVVQSQQPTFPWKPIPPSLATNDDNSRTDRNVSVVGVTLGIVTSVLIMTLLTVLVTHCCHSRSALGPQRKTSNWNRMTTGRHHHHHQNALNDDRTGGYGVGGERGGGGNDIGGGGHVQRFHLHDCYHLSSHGGGEGAETQIQTGDYVIVGSTADSTGSCRTTRSGCGRFQRFLRHHPLQPRSIKDDEEDEWQGKDLLDLRCLDDEDSDHIGVALTSTGRGGDQPIHYDGDPEVHGLEVCPKCQSLSENQSSCYVDWTEEESSVDHPPLASSIFQPLLLFQGVETELPRPDLLQSPQPKTEPQLSEKGALEERTEGGDDENLSPTKLSTSAPDIHESKDTPSGDIFRLPNLFSASVVLEEEEKEVDDDASFHAYRISQPKRDDSAKDDGADVLDAGCTTVDRGAILKREF